mmetsp:Transcript_3533/g.7718  ORF Transcript_3533/g.7718 Transcript_3533/m.7718 type:complete len:104 (+) Transcript_3533:170-481(+)
MFLIPWMSYMSVPGATETDERNPTHYSSSPCSRQRPSHATIGVLCFVFGTLQNSLQVVVDLLFLRTGRCWPVIGVTGSRLRTACGTRKQVRESAVVVAVIDVG